MLYRDEIRKLLLKFTGYECSVSPAPAAVLYVCSGIALTRVGPCSMLQLHAETWMEHCHASEACSSKHTSISHGTLSQARCAIAGTSCSGPWQMTGGLQETSGEFMLTFPHVVKAARFCLEVRPCPQMPVTCMHTLLQASSDKHA